MFGCFILCSNIAKVGHHKTPTSRNVYTWRAAEVNYQNHDSSSRRLSSLLAADYFSLQVKNSQSRNYRLVNMNLSKMVFNFITCRYWWLYGVNFIVYFLTSPRIRQAYLRFLADMLCLRRIKKQKNTEEQSETFWARGMEQGDGNHELEDVT